MRFRCRTCALVKQRNKSCNGYIDSKGKRWHAFQCPTCYVLERRTMSTQNRKKAATRTKEESITWDESFEQVPVYHKQKSCPKCKGKLELSRYFSCLRCTPARETDTYDEYSYEAIEINCKASEMSLLPGF